MLSSKLKTWLFRCDSENGYQRAPQALLRTLKSVEGTSALKSAGADGCARETAWGGVGIRGINSKARESISSRGLCLLAAVRAAASTAICACRSANDSLSRFSRNGLALQLH